MVMVFGKYRGVELADIPEGYLQWVVTVITTPRLRTAIEHELASRHNGQGPASTPPPKKKKKKATDAAELWPEQDLINCKWAVEIVDAGRRVLAKKHHPDVPGGSIEVMQLINVTADKMREVLSGE